MDSELFKASLLDTVIPDDNVTGAAHLLGTEEDLSSDTSRLLTIREREILFFDERMKAYAVLRLPHCDEDILKAYLSRLAYKIDVWAIDDSASNEPDAAAPPPKDLVFTLENIQRNEPVVLASQSADRGQMLTLVWEVELTISRPRLRTSQTSIILIPSGIISAAEETENGQPTDLTPFQPLDSNILEPMRLIPGFERTPPYLGASRLERVLPVASRTKPRIHIAQVPSRRYRAVPAVIARIHYSKFSNFSSSMMNLALLDIEVIPYIPLEAVVEHVDLVLKNGRTESVMPAFLPMHCQSGDCLTFMYKLYQEMDVGVSLGRGVVNPNVDILSVKVKVTISMTSRCKPVLVMDWTTHVDFTQALNPAFGPPAQPIQRANRPASLPVSNVNGSSTTMIATAMSLQPTHSVALRSGLSISFTASDAPVYVGQAFSWKILVVNNSPTPAKIAIIPLPRVHRQTTQAQLFARRHAPKSSTASFHPSERRHTKSGEDADIAQAIVDENVVYAMHHSNLVPPETDLMTLTSELRIGPLGPGQCHESEIQMVAFEAGTLRVDAMRVVDLVQEAEQESVNTSVMADIRNLPDVVVKTLDA